MKTKPLYIIGNGKSFKPEYLKYLEDKHTMGMNLGFRGFNQYSFFPTYYGFFEYDSNIYKLCDTEVLFKELDTFIDRGYSNTLCSVFALKNKTKFTNKFVQYFDLKTDNINYNTSNCLFNPPIDMHVNNIIENIKDQLPPNYKFLKGEILNDPQLWALDTIGLIKYLVGKKSDITPSNFITTPRCSPQFVLPTSFFEFYWQRIYNSSIMCVMIGILLGYQQFILTGMDSKFIINNQKLDYKDNYWFDGKTLDLKNLSHPTHGFNDVHFNGWSTFKRALSANNLPVEIINTTFASPLCNLFVTKDLLNTEEDAEEDTE